MNVDDLKEILDLVREHDLSEFELEREGLRLKVKKAVPWSPGPAPAMYPPLPAVALPAQPAPGVAAGPSAASRPAVEPPSGDAVDLAVVKSPIVGTFYRAPEPGAPPFVDVGGQVKKAQVLCIIEAMKLMNEIESDFEGEVVTVYVENGQPVQYGERLFAIRVK
jgi:acetyl-CoA carboxylase biotin carboxyl carrier protein